jgi:hypothetical protein
MAAAAAADVLRHYWTCSYPVSSTMRGMSSCPTPLMWSLGQCPSLENACERPFLSPVLRADTTVLLLLSAW